MKLSNSNFLKRELRENPEFYKAFPHLAPAEYNEQTQKITDAYREAPFFQSLLHQHNDYMTPLDQPEMLLRDNERNFVEAQHANVEGPHKYLTEEEKIKVHQELDKRL